MALARAPSRAPAHDDAVTILSIAYPFAPVGLDATGGAEQVLAILDRAFAEHGHRSLVIADSGSQIEGELIGVEIPAGATRRPDPVYRSYRNTIQSVLARYSVDLVHMHGLDFYRYLPPDGVPVLATLHLPPSFYPANVFRLSRPNTFLNCVSHSQLAACPRSPLLAGFVANGVARELFSAPLEPKDNYAFAMGRICPEKGFHLACEACSQARVPLRLAGKVFAYEEHQRYFRDVLQPALAQTGRFLGRLGLHDKMKWLASAKCLLVPSLVPETSSLAAMEALACGTPVIAFDKGALPEVVDHHKTGFIVHDVREMSEAIRSAHRIDPAICRRVAAERFSAENMIAQYLRLYDRALLPVAHI